MDGPLDEGDAAEIEIETISHARLQARACFPDAGERLGGAGRVNGAG
jgi:hypothetical protein